MVQVVNARDVDGLSLSFRVEQGKFAAVRTGEAAAPSAAAGGVLRLAETADLAALPPGSTVDAEGATLLPAGIDPHVHSRDPGLTHKEDWRTLAKGAWRGGVVAVCDMPNTLPPMMTRETTQAKAKIAAQSGLEFRLLLGVGASNISEVASLLRDPALPLCALKVFYGKTTGELMYDDLETLGRSLPEDGSKLIVFHSEDQCTIDCNQARLGAQLSRKDNASFVVHSEIRSSEAAHLSTKAILDWARTSYKRPIHIAHVSTALEVELVCEAKAQGVKVTCEVAPHHVLLSTDDYPKLGPLAKMNPPLRSPAEMEALAELVGKGLVDLFATDHAPHLLSEKQAAVQAAPSGVPSLELFWPLIFEVAQRTGLARQKAVAMGSSRAAELFGFAGKGRLADGFDADFAWLDWQPQRVRGEEVVSKCGWTPYDGWQLPCHVRGTWNRGHKVF